MKKVFLLAALGFVAAAGNAYAGDAAAGEGLFNSKCKICHAIGEGAKNKVGPELNGVDGRKMGSIADFKGYGADLKGMGDAGKAWDAATLATYLADPKAFNPGTKMAFAGFKADTAAAENVAAYVMSFGADGKKK
jgi:cytochrome c